MEAAGGRAAADPARSPLRLRSRLRGGWPAVDPAWPARRDRQSAGRSAHGRARGADARCWSRWPNPPSISPRMAIEIRDAAERVTPSIVKAVAALGPDTAGRARALFHAGALPVRARGRIYPPHRHLCLSPRRSGSASSSCPRAGSSSARSWSSCARWRRGCASTWPSLTWFPSVSILRPISSARARSCQPRSLTAMSDPSPHHRLPGRARRLFRSRRPHRLSGDDDVCPARPSRRPSPPFREEARPARHDPHQQFRRRPRRRHPPSAARIRGCISSASISSRWCIICWR